jgi:hypothetical protein
MKEKALLILALTGVASVGAIAATGYGLSAAKGGAATDMVEKTITYDATHNKASGVGSFTATEGTSTTTTGLYTTIGSPSTGETPVYTDTADYLHYVESGHATGGQPSYGINQMITFTTSGYFTSVHMVYSCNTAFYSKTYSPHINDGTSHYFNETYSENNDATATVTASNCTSLTLALVWGSNTSGFTFTVTSFSVSFYAKASC